MADKPINSSVANLYNLDEAPDSPSETQNTAPSHKSAAPSDSRDASHQKKPAAPSDSRNVSHPQKRPETSQNRNSSRQHASSSILPNSRSRKETHSVDRKTRKEHIQKAAQHQAKTAEHQARTAEHQAKAAQHPAKTARRQQAVSVLRRPDGILSFLKLYGHWLLFPFVLIYSDLFLIIFTGAGNRAFGLTLLFDIALGLILSAVTCFFKTHINRRIALIVLWVLVVYFSLHCTIFTSYQNYMSFKDIIAGAKQVMGGYASNAINAALAAIPKIFVFAIPAILYSIFGKKYLRPRRYKWPFSAALVVLSLVIFGFTLLFTNLGNVKNVYAKDYKFDSAVRSFGLATATRLDLKYLIFGNSASKGFSATTADAEEPSSADEESTAAEEETGEDAPKVYGKNIMNSIDFETAAYNGGKEVEELNAYVQSLPASSQNEYTGLFKGKNLILICAEAFSDAVIDPELTPTLYRLAHNGIYFSDYYQPAWGASTISGEYSMLMGIAPYGSVEINLDVRYNNNYFALGNQLQRQNYYNIAFHNGEYDFYSRYLTHQNFGYEKFLGYGNGMEDVGGYWVPDSDHLPMTLDTYINNTPFSVYYMTLSGHASYLEDSAFVEWYYDTVNDIVGDKYLETTKYYLCYQYDLELGLKAMVEKLEEAGIADDTVIVMTGDHYPYGLAGSDTWGNDQNYIIDLYQGPEDLLWERDHNSLILWSGCLENEYKDLAVEVSAPTFSLDIVPTLSNLFGLEYDSRLLAGRDVFSDQEPIVFWTTYSWITDKGKYDNDTGRFYPAEGVTVDDAYITRINNYVSDKIYFSYQVAEIDYYRYLFGDDTSVGRSVPYYDYLGEE